MAEEKVSISLEAKGAARFASDINNAELALRRQARALDESARALQKEVIALRGAVSPNRQLIAEKMRGIQERRLESAAIKANIAAMNQEARAAKGVTAEMKIMQGVTGGLSNTLKSFAGVFAGVIGLMSAGAVLKLAEDFNQLKGRVKNSLDSVAEFDGTMQKLIQSSNRSGQAIDGVVQAFVRLRPAAKSLGVTNDQLIQFNETFSKMGALAGATSEEVKNAMIQLSQGISSGTLRGDELRTVMEQMPPIARTIADSMGIPFEKFKKAAEEGKITADQVLKAVLGKTKETDAAFAQLPGSVGRSLNTLVNNLTVFIGNLNDALGATTNLSKGIQDLAGQFDKFNTSIKDNTSTSGQFLQILKDLQAIFSNLFQAVVTLTQAMDAAFKTGILGIGVMDLAHAAMNAIVIVLDLMASGAHAATEEMAGLIEATERVLHLDFQGAINKFKNRFDNAKDVAEGFFDRTQATLYPVNNGAGVARQQRTVSTGIRTITPTGKTKKGKSAAQIERERLEDIQRAYQHEIENYRAQAEYSIKKAGPFANQNSILNSQLISEEKVAGKLNQELIRLQNTHLKTADGQRALKEAVAKTKDEIEKQKTKVQEAKNELEKYQKELAFTDFKRNQEIVAASQEQVFSREKAGIEESTEVLKEQYAQRKVNINEYYDELQRNLDEQLEAEKKNSEAKIALLQAEIKERQKLNDEAGVKDLQAQIVLQQKALEDKIDDNKRDKDATQRQRLQDLQQAADEFGSQLQDAIAQALKAALTGNNPLQIIKQFAKSIYNALADSLSKAVAEGLSRTPFFQAISTYIGNMFNRISGRTGAGMQGLVTNSAGQATGLAPMFKEGSTLAQAEAGTATATSSGLAGIAKVFGPIMAAVGSFQAGKFFSQKFGKVGGGLAGAGAGTLMGALAGMAFGPVGAILGGALGGTIGGLAGIFGGGSNKQAQRAAYQQNTLAPYLNNLVSGADQNNLQDLQRRLFQARRGMEGRGEAGMEMKRQASAQLLQMIDQRKKTIAQFIKDITHQNEQLRDAIALADANPFEKAKLQHQIQIKEIEWQTKQLLEQYKDSEQAKTLILQQESLKRQQLAQQEMDSFKQKTQDLRDLLQERDDIANSNVFTRLRSREQVKADQLTELDRQIAQTILELQGMSAAGISAESLGSRQILAGTLLTNTNYLNIVVNESNDPAATEEAVTRALDSFYQKTYGAIA